MTTVLTCSTPDFVVLATDRAVSYQRGTSVSGSPVRTGKTVLLYGQFLMGFTGLATFDSKPVDKWVLDSFCGVGASAWPRRLADTTAGALERVHGSLKGKSHTFASIGFAGKRGEPKSAWKPGRIVISNSSDVDGEPLGNVSRDMSIHVKPHDESKWAEIHAYGLRPSRDLLNDAERILRRYQNRDKGAAQGCVEILGRIISGVSLVTDTVSPACLVSVLPRTALQTSNVDVPVGTGSYVADDAITCLNFIGPEDRLEDQDKAYVPAVVFPNGSVAYGHFGP